MESVGVARVVYVKWHQVKNLSLAEDSEVEAEYPNVCGWVADLVCFRLSSCTHIYGDWWELGVGGRVADEPVPVVVGSSRLLSWRGLTAKVSLTF